MFPTITKHQIDQVGETVLATLERSSDAA